MTTWKQLERRARIERRRDLAIAGRRPALVRHIWRVATTEIAVPDWALEQSIPDLSSTRDYVWLTDEWLARKLHDIDKAEGGSPELTRVEARRCEVCGMLRLGLLAEQRRKLDESAIDGRKLPCSADCLTRVRQKRGQ